MSIPVLVYTSTPGFGALIQQTLEDTGRYQVSLTADPAEALVKAKNTALAIVDTSEATLQQDDPVFELSRQVKEQFSNLRLVVVPPENDPEHPIVRELRANGTLTKPFYLPELEDTVEKALEGWVAKDQERSDVSEATAGMQADAPVMITANRMAIEAGKLSSLETATGPDANGTEDSYRAGQVLSRALAGSNAQAALILKNGKLWASAGNLPQAAAQELARKISQYRDPHGNSDLARYVRLETTRTEVMLYTTRLGGEMALALVFLDTPLSKMRSQASAMARALSSPQAAREEPVQAPPDLPADDEETGAESEEASSIPIALPPLFDNVPSPSPDGWKSTAPETSPMTETSPAPVSGDSPQAGEITQPTALQEAIPVPLEVVESQKQETQKEIPELTPEPLADTRPVVVNQPGTLQEQPSQVPLEKPPVRIEDFQPASTTTSDINYSCVLIPRLPDHQLIGELSARLPEWMRQLCLAFDWRLDYLSVRPHYLLWIVHVPPTVSPSFVVRMMRLHTSQRIFTRFTGFAVDNPSGDFWAPGYLVMSGSQPPPAQVMADFVQQTRHRQGAGSLIPQDI